MSSRRIRLSVRSLLSVALVSLVVLGYAIAAPISAAPAFALICLAFAITAILGGRAAALAAIAVGALESAFVLPGEGFAVSNPGDALSLIAAITTGLLIAWYVGRVDVLREDVRTSSQIANWKSVAHSELTHRLTNDLSIMVAMASLKGREAKSVETREALNDLGERLVVLGRVYQRLDVRDRDQDDNVSAREFLYDLCDDLQLSTLSMSSLALQLDVDDMVRLPIRTLSVVGLIINELLTNVRKHAYPERDGGQVLLYLHRHVFLPNCLELVVTDDGAGFAGGMIRREASGSNLLSMLASQIGGTLFYSRILQTTVATLQFPAPPAPRLEAVPVIRADVDSRLGSGEARPAHRQEQPSEAHGEDRV
ncbi:hypothetical protein GCM10009087_18330 [Sphingomonas oligophenolica]|uniref:histidine kinase n=1 Tax=Sphingomonas oligophenolica TaxID=301154 RepID=A0ABU9Y3D1_9SPHN